MGQRLGYLAFIVTKLAPAFAFYEFIDVQVLAAQRALFVDRLDKLAVPGGY